MWSKQQDTEDGYGKTFEQFDHEGGRMAAQGGNRGP